MESTTQLTTDNITAPVPTKQPALYLAYNITMMAVTFVIMFSMGSGTTWMVIKKTLKKPIGPVIGVICQCIIFPAMMYGYARALNIDGPIAVGMVLCACCPGGAVSNMFTFWSRGDLDLSITMTTIATCLSIGFMPLNMFIYVRSWISVSEIPFVDIVVTIIVVWVAVILGHLVGRFFPKSVYHLTRIGSVCGFILMLIVAAMQGALFPEVFDLDWSVWFAAVSMPLIAFCVGFFVPWIFCLELPQRTAIAIEVSLQNVALAITILTVAFPNAEEASLYSQYVTLYAVFQTVFGTGIAILFQSIFRYFESTTPCHYYSRWKQGKEKALCPDLQKVTVNGSTIHEDPANAQQKPEGITNMTYRGSSLDLTQIQADDNGSGFVVNGQVDSTTELVRMDSTDSRSDLINGIQRVDSLDGGHISFNCDQDAISEKL